MHIFKYNILLIGSFYRPTKRQNIDRNDRYHLENGKLVNEEMSLTNNHKFYDLTYNTGDYGYKRDEKQNFINKGTSVNRPDNSYLASLWPIISRESNSMEYGISERYPVDYDHEYKSSTNDYSTPIHVKESRLNLHEIGILALIKFFLLKLQVIGFQKIILFLVFKLKLFMAAMLFKFLLIMKLMKFFKILILPLLLMQLLPIIMQLLRMRLENSTPEYTRPSSSGIINGITDSVPILSSGGTTSGVTSGNLLGGGTGGTLVPQQTTINRLPGGSTLLPNSIAKSRLSDESGLSFLKSNHQNGQYRFPLKLPNPTLDIFEKLLDSKKCLNKIACRIAVAEKAGIMPFWMNW